jgi:hypothetical protein
MWAESDIEAMELKEENDVVDLARRLADAPYVKTSERNNYRVLVRCIDRLRNQKQPEGKSIG